MGGLSELLFLVFIQKDISVRKAACRILSSIFSNNIEVQDFARKSGAINLTILFEKEDNPSVKEAILSCLSAYLRG